MKKLLFLLILCSVFGACNNDEMERLKKENETLKVQINILRGSELSKSKNATEVTSEKKSINRI